MFGSRFRKVVARDALAGRLCALDRKVAGAGARGVYVGVVVDIRRAGGVGLLIIPGDYITP